MAVITGAGAQGASAKGRIGSTVFQTLPTLPGGTVFARTHVPYPFNPHAVLQTPRRLGMKLANLCWKAAYTGSTITNADWIALGAQQTPWRSGWNMFAKATLDWWSLGGFIPQDTDPGVPVPSALGVPTGVSIAVVSNIIECNATSVAGSNSVVGLCLGDTGFTPSLQNLFAVTEEVGAAEAVILQAPATLPPGTYYARAITLEVGAAPGAAAAEAGPFVIT